jgi:hypothetical protein
MTSFILAIFQFCDAEQNPPEPDCALTGHSHA